MSGSLTTPSLVGVQLPEVEREVRWPEIVAIARAAEEVGFDSLWLGDHLLYRAQGTPDRAPWDVWTQLAALAAVTERVRLGTLVASLAFHAPGVLARMAASVDEISGGRLVLGVGAGWNEPEFQAFGLPFDHLGPRFAESFDIVRRLLDGEVVTVAGRFHQVTDAVLLPRTARHVPLMVGSNGARVLAAALPHVDAWNTWYSDYGNTADGFRQLNDKVNAACARASRDPRTVQRSACVLVAIGTGGERPHDVPPVLPDRLAGHLRDLAGAGVNEAILVVDPITEASVRELAGHLG